MSSNVYCSDEIFKQIKIMFHTLKWECLKQDNNIRLYRKHFELEVFEINITDKYIYLTIPFLDAQVNLVKKSHWNIFTMDSSFYNIILIIM